jgi:hypothetical protein
LRLESEVPGKQARVVAQTSVRPPSASCDPAEVAHIERETAKDPNNIGVGVIDLRTGQVRLFSYDETNAFSDALPGFLDRTAGHLLPELARLEEQAQQAPAAIQPKAATLVAGLEDDCRRLIDLLEELASFRALPLDRVRVLVSQVPLLRGACVRRIEELEACFQTPQRFYSSRPAQATGAVNDFLADLERVFVQEWSASGQPRSWREGRHARPLPADGRQESLPHALHAGRHSQVADWPTFSSTSTRSTAGR